MEPITLNDLMSAIASCQESVTSRGATAQEIATQTRRDVFCVRREIAKAIEGGTVECVREKRRCIDGVLRSLPVYRTVNKARKGKA